jgi:hypothetical protein
LTAAEVKDALRARHHAAGGNGGMPGEWTCLEELFGIDLLAWSAWSKNTRIGYEVKVSRSDYRRELLAPDKRATAVALCNEFYLAVPNGLLTSHELAYREPGDLRPSDFQRERCPGVPGITPVERPTRLFGEHDVSRYRFGGQCRKASAHDGALRGKHTVLMPRPAVLEAQTERERLRGPDEWRIREHGQTLIVCPTCQGRGYIAKSRVEQEAPTLWVPADVGLVVIYETGTTRVLRKAPYRRNGERTELTSYQVAQAIRWTSIRPDPRHVHDRRVLEAVA